MIYFIQQGDDGPVKIGFTQHRRGVKQRLESFQIAHAVRLHVRAVIPGEREDEGILHRFLDSYRLRGEWFAWDSDSLIAFACVGDQYAVNLLDQAWSWNRFWRLGMAPSSSALLHYVMMLEWLICIAGIDFDFEGEALSCSGLATDPARPIGVNS